MDALKPQWLDLVGYDKDSDLYEHIAYAGNVAYLQEKAERLMKAGARCRETGEPFDWFEIRETASDKTVVIVV